MAATKEVEIKFFTDFPKELRGNGVVLRPFDADADARVFAQEAMAEPEMVMNAGNVIWPKDLDKCTRIFSENVRACHASETSLLFAILDTSSGQERLAGYTRIKEIDRNNLTFVTGCVIFKRYRRSHVSTVRRWLTLNWAFSPISAGGLGLRRTEGIVYGHNMVSLAANLRAGYTIEAVQRSALVANGGAGATLFGQPNVDFTQSSSGRPADCYLVAITVKDWASGVRDKLKALADRPVAPIDAAPPPAKPISTDHKATPPTSATPKADSTAGAKIDPPTSEPVPYPEQLVGNGVALRPFDVDRWAPQYHQEMLKDSDAFALGLGAVWPEDYAQAKQILQSRRDRKDYMLFAVLDTSSGEERLAGYAGIKDIDMATLTVETSCTLFRRYRRSGVNTIRRWLVLDYLFAPPPRGLGIRRATVANATYNIPSLASNLKAGYQLEGCRRCAVVIDPPLTVGKELTGELGQPERGNSADFYLLSITSEDWEGGLRETMRATAERPPVKVTDE